LSCKLIACSIQSNNDAYCIVFKNFDKFTKKTYPNFVSCWRPCFVDLYCLGFYFSLTASIISPVFGSTRSKLYLGLLNVISQALLYYNMKQRKKGGGQRKFEGEPLEPNIFLELNIFRGSSLGSVEKVL